MKGYPKDTIDKLGNAIVYLCGRIPDMSITKLLKLIYLIEECSVKKFHAPFFGIDFEVWQAGPVAKDIYIDLSDDYRDPFIFREYLSIDTTPKAKYVLAKRNFNNDEFSDNDISVMDYIINKYGDKTARWLVKFTHKENTAWFAAAKENELLDSFAAGTKNSSDVLIDFGYYLSECDKAKYQETQETWKAFDILKK